MYVTTWNLHGCPWTETNLSELRCLERADIIHLQGVMVYEALQSVYGATHWMSANRPDPKQWSAGQLVTMVRRREGMHPPLFEHVHSRQLNAFVEGIGFANVYHPPRDTVFEPDVDVVAGDFGDYRTLPSFQWVSTRKPSHEADCFSRIYVRSNSGSEATPVYCLTPQPGAHAPVTVQIKS